MRRRRHVRKSRSKKLYRRGRKMNKRNRTRRPMRGGIRL